MPPRKQRPSSDSADSVGLSIKSQREPKTQSHAQEDAIKAATIEAPDTVRSQSRHQGRNLAGSGVAHKPPRYHPIQQTRRKQSRRKKRDFNRRAGSGAGATMRSKSKQHRTGGRERHEDGPNSVERDPPACFRRDRKVRGAAGYERGRIGDVRARREGRRASEVI